MILIGGLDTETTGLEQEKGHRIVEACLRLHDLESRRLIGSMVARINPERPIDPKAEAVHGIKFEDLVTCPTWDTVGPKLGALMGKLRYVVVHNAGFDMPFIYRELMRIGQPTPKELGVVDTMLQARWATPDGSIPNLGALAFAAGVDYDKEKAHGAEYDVDVMMQAFFKHLDRGFFTLPTEPFRLETKATA